MNTPVLPGFEAGYKHCYGPCKETKKLDEFGARKTAKDGKNTVCKKCGVKMTLSYQQGYSTTLTGIRVLPHHTYWMSFTQTCRYQAQSTFAHER